MNGCSFEHVVHVQVDETVEVTDPSVSTRLIAQLRLHEAGDHCDGAVHVALFVYSGFVDHLVGVSQYLLCEEIAGW